MVTTSVCRKVFINRSKMTSGAGDYQEKTEIIVTAKKLCLGLQSEDKRTRKQTLIDLQNHITEQGVKLTDDELKVVFNETHIHTLNALRDKAEAVRSQAIKFMSFLILQKLPKNDYYLTYVFPVLVERIGSVELVEESEEIRLEMLQFMQAIILKYANTVQLKPFLNDCVIILCETVKDKHPEVKEISCKCVTNLAQALPRDFHMQAENLVKPVLSIFGYQRYKIRVEAVKCMGDIVMHSKYQALDQAVGPMAERLFDQIPAVRQAVIGVAARWLLEYIDRYSFFQKLLPLLLTGLHDEIPETRKLAHQLWQIVGIQYERENENDLKDQLDFLTIVPKHYPEKFTRPSLGCRVLVQRNVGKLAPALARELGSWQTDVKIRCSQLLCAIALCSEEGLTQHLQELLCAMYLTARDDDERVVENIITASELIGVFVPVDSWQKLIIPAIEDGAHFGHLSVLAGLIRGAPKDYILPYLDEIALLLQDESVCRRRKAKYQQEMIKCVKAIMQKCDPAMFDIGKNLFTIIVTTIALKDPENADINIDLLDELYTVLGLNSQYEVWNKYTNQLLVNINKDPFSWSTVTEERCIFEVILTESGAAFGENLSLIGDILGKTLNIEADPESRLKTFIALSITLDCKDKAFQNASNLNNFLQKLITEVLVPTLVWHAGRTAEAMRTVAVSCLCSALNPGTEVDLFPDSEVFRSFFDNLSPLLISLIEDASSKSRQLALEALLLLKETAVRRECWKSDDLVKIYPEIMKRLDDPTDSVRITSIKALTIMFANCPEEFKKSNYCGHHTLTLDTLLTHFDDDDENLQKLIGDCIMEMVNVCGETTVTNKINHHTSLLRNKEGLNEIIEKLKNNL